MGNLISRYVHNHLSIYKPGEEGRFEEIRHLGILVDRWLSLLNKTKPDAVATRKAERVLNVAIRTGQFFGKILSFAGLNIWVDDRTREGGVSSQEAIDL